jgi:uncharacterized membrane protein YeiH
MDQTTQRFIVTVDLAGTFLFAAEGAATAIAGQLDFFGVMVLSFVTAVGGGVCFVLRMVSVWQHWQLPRISLS